MTEEIKNSLVPYKLRSLTDKVLNGTRIDKSEALQLINNASPGLLGLLADKIRSEKNGSRVWYVHNFHIEPTNICIHRCKFCAFRSEITGDAWELSLEEIREIVSNADRNAGEVHITGGVHPDRDLEYYIRLIRLIREVRPDLHIKAYSAVEIDDMAQRAGVIPREILIQLKEAGLDALPGGGAEIFSPELRKVICPDKTDASGYLSIHRDAHSLGISSNATMLYGHLENWEQRVDHILKVRELQDETGGFKAFIPLKFRRMNNSMSEIKEGALVDDLRVFAISRLLLDNIDHIKAYWPMLGKSVTGLLLGFGVDDIDGTINDTTRIYSRAGAEERNPVMTIEEFEEMSAAQGRKAVLRNADYQEIG